MKKTSRGDIPLPAANRNEELETVSRNKLLCLLDPRLFEVRPENIRDKGNDFIVEVKQDDLYTNFHFSIQLKATNSIKPMKDGSISYPVPVSNIHYLSNYAMPAYYILYDCYTDKFYIEQADHVFRNLSKKYPTQKYPKSFNIQFSQPLTPEKIQEMYKHTLEKGMLLRRLNPHFNPTLIDTSKATRIVIDEDNEVYSVDQNIAFINEYGLLLLNKADFQRIIEIEQRTHPRTTASPTFNLVCGIAYFQHADLYKAMDFLKHAQQHSGEFPPEISSMLTYTFLNAKYLLGIITEGDLKSGTNQLLATEKIGSFLQLERSFRSLASFKGSSRENIQQFYTQIQQLITSEPDNKSLVIMAYAHILEAEERVLINDLTNNMVSLYWKAGDLTKTKPYQEWETFAAVYSTRLKQLIEFAFKETNYLAMSNLAMDKIKWSFTKMFITHTFSHWNNKTLSAAAPLNKEDEENLLTYIDYVGKTAESYKFLAHQENLISCLMFKYELLIFSGRLQEAETISREIYHLIESNDFVGLRARYLKLLAGNTRYWRFVNTLKTRMGEIREIMQASGIDDSVLDIMPEEAFISTGQKTTWSIDHLLDFQFPS
ncbi:MAG TPA: DUF4365 domain-containing protein [Puia sp.]|nr:DUF4365 domain-containing protein [Puia sp.]